MSERIKFFSYALWSLHPILQIGIVAFMLRRGLVRQFKFFFGYILTQLAIFAVLFPAYCWRSYSAAFYLYWGCNAISVALGFLVIHEVFVDVFRLFHTLRDLGTVLFKWAGLVMLLVAGVVSVSANSPEMSPWMQAIVTSQRCVRIIQVGMVLFLLFFAHYVGINRRQLSFGIALGFGSFAVMELIVICTWVGNHLSGLAISLLNMGAYLKRPARDASFSLLQPQRWEQSLSDIHNPVPADSLIPMFEGMVDRALSRSQQHLTSASLEPTAKLETRAAVAGSRFTEIVRSASKT
jgi:hypothetical protein